VASSPLEQEKIDLEKGIEFSRAAILKYGEKKNKLAELKNKLEGKDALMQSLGRRWSPRRSMSSWWIRQGSGSLYEQN